MSHPYPAPYASPYREADGPLSDMTAALGNLLRSNTGGGSSSSSSNRGRPIPTIASILRRRLVTLPTVLLLSWFWLLHWGERYAFSSSIAACEWDKWEKWPSHAQPHRAVLLADPQLVDPHTYPGRPWPLSTLTVSFTDKYLSRSYRLLQGILDPDTTFFLGDLFDGGREWATEEKPFQSSEDQWKKYGELFWIEEYNRFGNIFFKPDQVSGRRSADKSKKIIASLPGNHDLGFGNGIQKPVRDRFRAYFGESDRIDVLGNHTFVSLDTVSLSAMGQPDAPESLWNETMLFLDQAQHLKARALQKLLDSNFAQTSAKKHPHDATIMHEFEVDKYTQKPTKRELDPDLDLDLNPKQELPTIVLTHVPFYRDPATPCGPLRERYPPSAPNLAHDHPNAIRVAAGYQYQNVLTLDITKMIASKVGNVGYVFSGDDHDYCETVHHSYASAGAGIREITVKSMSWAMGVRKPGFLLVSLWNPIDKNGQSLHEIQGGQSPGSTTVQTHLCLLPDQLSTFIRYGIYAALSVIVLMVNAVRKAKSGGSSSSPTTGRPVLPISEPKKGWTEKAKAKVRSRAASGSAHLPTENGGNSLSARSFNARTRSVSPAPNAVGVYGLPTFKAPLIEQAGYYGNHVEVQDGDSDEWGHPTLKLKPPRPKTFREQVVETFAMDVGYVGGVALVWYWWLWRS